MSRYFEKTMMELKKFIDMTPILENITFSKEKDEIFAVYDWGQGKAYTRWVNNKKTRKIYFSVDYGIRCDEAYYMQVSTFLSLLNEKNEEVNMVLHSDGSVISEGSLSYKNAPLKDDDFDELFTSSLFFERFVNDIRKLSIGGFVYTREIIESKLEEKHSLLFDDLDEDDDFDDVETSGLFGRNINPLKPPELPDIDSLLHRISNQQETLKSHNDITPNENAELVNLINSSNKKEDDKEEP